jgi:hypothetical protein
VPRRLVIPHDVAVQVLDVLERRHPEHLAELERDLGWAPKTIPMLQTVEHLANEGFRLKEDRAPAVLVGMFGAADPPERGKDGYSVAWTMAVEVTVEGTGRADVLMARDFYMATVAECILDRVPRAGAPIDGMALEDVDLVPVAREQDQRLRAQARMLFTVTVRGALGRGVLPPDNSTTPPGTPGGPPSHPYTPPEDWPHVTEAHTTTIREPLQ